MLCLPGSQLSTKTSREPLPIGRVNQGNVGDVVALLTEPFQSSFYPPGRAIEQNDSVAGRRGQGGAVRRVAEGNANGVVPKTPVELRHQFAGSDVPDAQHSVE